MKKKTLTKEEKDLLLYEFYRNKLYNSIYKNKDKELLYNNFIMLLTFLISENLEEKYRDFVKSLYLMKKN